jgi:uncharacterized protein YggL (DUF469 family)
MNGRIISQTVVMPAVWQQMATFSNALKRLQQAGALRAEVTVESLINEAEEARCLAMKGNRPSAAVAAIVCKAKLAGVWDAPEEAAEGYSRMSTADIIAELARIGVEVKLPPERNTWIRRRTLKTIDVTAERHPTEPLRLLPKGG